MSNTLHNAIMEAGGKDRPPMLAPSNYVQWKSRIKKYIDTKPNHELIHYCLENPPYKFMWANKEVPISKGSSVTTTETYMETYKNVSQDIRDQLNAEAEAVSNDDHYNVFAIEIEHPEQSKYVHDTYPIEQDEHNVIIDSLAMSYDREQIDQNDDDNDLSNKRGLLASLIEKLKCEIDDNINRNKFLETSNKMSASNEAIMTIKTEQRTYKRASMVIGSFE
nr:hypothetical protein [Tanacetum cinerariifolium]